MTIAQMRAVLKAAGIYNLLWGAAVVLAPAATLRLFNYPPQPTPELWQCIGMIVGKEAEIVVKSVRQSSAGRMIFGRLPEPSDR